MKFKGILSNGFRYEVESDFADDYEFLELLGEVENNPLLVTKVVTTVLGEKQKDNLIKYLKKRDGKAKLSTMQNLIGELFEKLKQKEPNIKN